MHLHKTIPRPLREESNGDDNAHAATISWSPEEGRPADARGDLSVQGNSGLDFLEFILYQRVVPVAVCVVVSQSLQGLFLPFGTLSRCQMTS